MPSGTWLRPDTDVPVGAVSAILLNQIRKQFLQPAGTQRIAKLTIKVRIPEEPSSVELTFEDGLYGYGQPPVENVVSLQGVRHVPALGAASIRIGPRPPLTWIRCDANGDRTSDISDGIYLLGNLFLGGKALECPASADCNSDGTFDISDAIYDLAFLFTGGAPPASPFPACDFFGGCEANCP
jgi:hypothetical protein